MPNSVELACHPTTLNPAIRSLDVSLDRAANGLLALCFRLEGALSRLRIPSPASPRMTNHLWEHTCFEAFVAVGDEPAYHEFNFSPSRAWGAHSFRDYRNGGWLDEPALDPRIVTRSGRDRFELDARVALDRLSPAHVDQRLRIGLSAVIEADDESRSYWALRHPSVRPDFHRIEAFALLLESP